MSTCDISATHYPVLLEALRLLPGISPRQARDHLGEAKYLAARSPGHTAVLNGVRVTLGQLEELFVRDQQGRPRVSPAGAAVLLHLFEEGALPVDDRKVEGNCEVLAQYAKGLATVIAFDHRRGAPRKARSGSGNAARAQRHSPGLGTVAPQLAQVAGASLPSFKCFIHRLI
jgi:hypothetical protein